MERLENEELNSENIISRFKNFFGKMLKGKKIKELETVNYSKFQHFLAYSSADDPMFEKIAATATLCDEALRITRQRLVLAEKIKGLDEKLKELDCFFRLDETDAHKLKDLLERFISLTKERNILMYQLVGFDKTVARMGNLETDANSAIPQIQSAEKSNRILKRDISYIEGEKAELEYERNMLETGISFINKFGIFAVVMFGIVTLYLGYSFMINENPIFVPTTIMVLLAIVVYSLVYLFNKRMKYELRVNIKKQQKAVTLLNKKNTVNVYYTNFLRFEYKKYKVRNANALKSSLSEYSHYKHITARVDAIRKIMYATEAEIEKFLKEKNINYKKFTIEQFAKTINVSDKIDYTRELMRDREIFERELFALDEKHSGVWELIESIAESDSSEDKIIAQMVAHYFEEVSRMMFTIEKAVLSEEGENPLDDELDGTIEHTLEKSLKRV